VLDATDPTNPPTDAGGRSASGGRSTVLADYTTIRLGGPATGLVWADDEATLVECVTRADAEGAPVLVLGGGSNLVVADAGFDGVVVRVAHRGMRFDRNGEHVHVHVEAGEIWDDVVAASLAQGLAGLESLSGIPGLAGATPIQNVGAYGCEISSLVVAVRVFDRSARREIVLSVADCDFGYRTSALRGGTRYVVLGIELQLRADATSQPVGYQQLADALGVELGGRAPAADVRAAVLALRASKGMLIDPADPDSVSVGSFFTNPVLSESDVPAGAPRWPGADGRVKTSAAWLIEQAGFHRGFGDGRVGLSGKHTLALVNRGGATTAELIAFATRIRDGVVDRFGVALDVEPALVGVRL
jgi:UDP-N-acetylmuramate dehydrogenase